MRKIELSFAVCSIVLFWSFVLSFFPSFLMSTPDEEIRDLATRKNEIAAEIAALDAARETLLQRKQRVETELGHLTGVLPAAEDAALREAFAFVYNQSRGHRLELILCEAHPIEQIGEDEDVAAGMICEIHPPRRHQYSLELKFRYVHPHEKRFRLECRLTTKCEVVKQVLYELVAAWGFSPTWPLHWRGDVRPE